MHRLTWTVAAWAAVAAAALAAPLAAALAAPPAEETVQGLYEGVRKDAGGPHKVEARVVAQGGGAFKVYLREAQPGGQVAKAELDGKTEGDAVRFAGRIGDADWTADWTPAAARATGVPAGLLTPGDGIAGRSSQGGVLTVERVIRKPPTLGAKPPPGAVVLLGGRTMDEMVKKPLKDGAEQPWKPVEGGGVEIPKGGMDSKRSFDGGLRLHVEFRVPFRPKDRGQGRGNSGVFLPNGQEIQVLDSFGMTTYTGGGCGGLYKWKDPDAFDEFSLASLPPLEWQTYDVEYRVPKGGGGPRLTVLHNGIKIHDNVELKGAARAGPLRFQDHGNPVQYRNIWVAPLAD